MDNVTSWTGPQLEDAIGKVDNRSEWRTTAQGRPKAMQGRYFTGILPPIIPPNMHLYIWMMFEDV